MEPPTFASEAGDIPADPAASNNVAIGFRAHARTSGSLNVCIGNNAGREATRFDSVTIVGSNRSKANGDGTLHLAKTLQDSSAFGAGCNLGHNNSTVIGAGAASTKDNQVVLGGSATVEVKTAGTYEGVIGGIPQRMVGQLELGLILGAGNPSGVAEFDLGTARHFTHTLTENATLRVINLNPAGTGLVNEFDCLFFQDAVGGFTLTLPANFKAIGNSLKVMPATKNTYALFSAITYDFGVTWYYVMQECEA
jgi:hypothetical protein